MALGRDSLRALRERVRSSQERTLEAAQQAQRKREQKRARRAARPPRAEVPTFGADAGGQTPPRVINSTQVQEWFRSGLRDLYGDKLTLPPKGEWWTIHEKGLAKKLLNAYGPELVQKAVAHFCATWPQRVEASEGRLGGIPGIGLLWKIRDRVFAEAQGVAPPPVKPKPRRARRNKKDEGEYTPGKPVGFGWET